MVEYWRDGVPAVADYSDRVVVRAGADGYDDTTIRRTTVQRLLSPAVKAANVFR